LSTGLISSEANFTRALPASNIRVRRLPQTIAHRGYKAAYPENTMASFTGALAAGAHAIETDIHLTRDNVVVLSHDATLERCFGRKEKTIDCTWEEIRDLETLAKPKQHMPRLKDLLELVARSDHKDIWLLLDIKLDNDANDVIRLIAETIRNVKPAEGRPWKGRIVLGCWAVSLMNASSWLLSY